MEWFEHAFRSKLGEVIEAKQSDFRRVLSCVRIYGTVSPIKAGQIFKIYDHKIERPSWGVIKEAGLVGAHTSATMALKGRSQARRRKYTTALQVYHHRPQQFHRFQGIPSVVNK